MDIKINWRSVWAVAFCVALGWQLLMTIIGMVLETNFTNLSPAAVSPLSHMIRWDGGWFYSIIANNSYALAPGSQVFYPLFPLSVISVQTITLNMLSVSAAALAVNTVTLWLAIVALVRIVEHFEAGRYKWLAVALFLTGPTAIFLHFTYAEAIFCALAFWAYLFALRRQWVWMSVLLSLLMVVKIPALLVIGLCFLEFWRAHDWSLRKIWNRNLAVFAIVPVGFVMYGLYLRHVTGDFFMMFHAYDLINDWTYHQFNPNFLVPIINAAKTVILGLLGRAENLMGFVLIGNALPLAGLVLVGAASLYAIVRVKGAGVPLGIAGLVSIVFFSINNNLVSVHRYVLPSLVLYLIPVLIIQKYPRFYIWAYPVMAVGVALQMLLFWFFVSGRFAG